MNHLCAVRILDAQWIILINGFRFNLSSIENALVMNMIVTQGKSNASKRKSYFGAFCSIIS